MHRGVAILAGGALTVLALAGCISTSEGPGQVRTSEPPAHWADPEKAAISPGSLVSADHPCPVGFVMTGGNLVYVSIPATCLAGVGERALVAVDGAQGRAIVAFVHTSAPLDGRGDFALLQMDADDRSRIWPGLPTVGGPSALAVPGDVGPQDPVWVASIEGGQVVWMPSVVTYGDAPHELEVASVRGLAGGLVVAEDGSALGIRSGVTGREPGTEVVVPLWPMLQAASAALGQLELETTPWDPPASWRLDEGSLPVPL